MKKRLILGFKKIKMQLARCYYCGLMVMNLVRLEEREGELSPQSHNNFDDHKTIHKIAFGHNCICMVFSFRSLFCSTYSYDFYLKHFFLIYFDCHQSILFFTTLIADTCFTIRKSWNYESRKNAQSAFFRKI